MYVDYSIPVCSKLPSRVLEDIARLDKYYAENDMPNYVMLEESVESDLKNCCEQRIISVDEFKAMYRRFGWL